MQKYTKGVVFAVQHHYRTREEIAEMKQVHERVTRWSTPEEQNSDYYRSLCEALTLLEQQETEEEV